MVRGVGIAVTRVAGRYQCAETQSTARGHGMFLPMDAQPSVQAFCVSAFIGLPCPKKMAGMGFVILDNPYCEVVSYSHFARYARRTFMAKRRQQPLRYRFWSASSST